VGPLAGVKILEMAGIGPGPMCGLLLSDLGATVLRIERREPSGIGIPRPAKYDLMTRGRKLLALDLKDLRATDVVLDLVAEADALLEPFRPGVMERLGLGPQPCLARNPRLVYARMTGWGQTGPLAPTAGHDLNYVALSGALHAFGRKGEPPTPPINIAGDYAGALYMALGLVAAVLNARQTGQGQIVDTAMSDCAAHLMTNYFGLAAAGLWSLDRGTNITDTGAFFYDVFECKDGCWISIACIEKKFFTQMVELIGIDPASLPPQEDRNRWEEGKKILAAHIKTRDSEDWRAILEGTDACFAPVLSIQEAVAHPHSRSRETFVEIDGIVQPSPQPKFSRTVPDIPTPPPTDHGFEPEAALAGWHFSSEKIATLRAAGVVGRGPD
jgi:alpha-methylacyl-CoA racemase